MSPNSFNPDRFVQARWESVAWARDLLNREDWMILDTETTGLGMLDQIIQLSACDFSGRPILDTLIKPSVPLTVDAQLVHHITPGQLENAPAFIDIANHFREALNRFRMVIIYNAAFDTRMIRQTSVAAGIPPNEFFFRYTCAMIKYSQWVGQWNQTTRSFRWQKLPGGDHTAMGDCLATLDLIRLMAKG